MSARDGIEINLLYNFVNNFGCLFQFRWNTYRCRYECNREPAVCSEKKVKALLLQTSVVFKDCSVKVTQLSSHVTFVPRPQQEFMRRFSSYPQTRVTLSLGSHEMFLAQPKCHIFPSHPSLPPPLPPPTWCVGT